MTGRFVSSRGNGFNFGLRVFDSSRRDASEVGLCSALGASSGVVTLVSDEWKVQQVRLAEFKKRDRQATLLESTLWGLDSSSGAAVS